MHLTDGIEQPHPTYRDNVAFEFIVYAIVKARSLKRHVIQIVCDGGDDYGATTPANKIDNEPTAPQQRGRVIILNLLFNGRYNDGRVTTVVLGAIVVMLIDILYAAEP